MVTAVGIGFIVIVIGVEVAEVALTHPVGVMIILTVFPVTSIPLVKKELVAPTTLIPFTCHWYAGVPALTGVALKVTVVPAQTVLPGVGTAVTKGVSDGVSERLPKLVTPVVIPVNPAALEAVILPAAAPVEVACTCKPDIVMASSRVMAETPTLIVN
jgi:hypothetical protein